jgi:hypothetical protein
MDINFPVELIDLLYLMLILMGISLVLAVILLGWVVWRIRRIKLPPGADFFTALRATPLSVAILLDLLDFGLDIFAAPFAWTILGYLGLKPLRNVSVIESLIPGTQFLPTMTVAWFIARQIGPDARFQI